MFTPPSGRDKSLDIYTDLVNDDIVANLKKSDKLNISKEENVTFMSYCIIETSLSDHPTKDHVVGVFMVT